ncbi:MAG: hypothetical protein DMD91_19900 [Candidatus Rokuibacteriota bacterium]|nr:MAG: hypothetical protein DMD91_19900 [Candidatus Rokubacteria bacterium]
MRRLALSLRPHLVSGLFFVGAVVFLFRLPLFYGYRFVGNSDRWNHYLSFVRFYSDNLAEGRVWAWSEHLLLGFDTLKFIVPTPLYALPVILGSRDVVKTFGYVAPAVLLAALFTAYYVIYRKCGDRLAATCGAAIYALSTFSLLKLSQNDATYVAVLVAPIMFYLVDSVTRANIVRRTVLLASLVTLGIFLSPQKFSYLILFLGCYVVYLFARGRRTPLVGLGVALPVGAILALPRTLALMANTLGSTRTQSSLVLESVGPSLALRFLDIDILGRDWREAFEMNQVNLSEGNLLFASMFASLWLLSIVARGRYTTAIDVEGEHRHFHYGFFVAFTAFVFAVIHLPFVYRFFGQLYAGMPFLHTRFAVAALFPIALVSAVNLTRPQSWRLPAGRLVIIGGIVVAVLVVGQCDFRPLSRTVLWLLRVRPSGFVKLSDHVFVVSDEMIRLVVMAGAFAGIGGARVMGWLDRGSFRTCIALIILGQAVLAGDHYLNGHPTRSYTMPFERHDLLMARPGDFLPPTPDQLARLHRMLDDTNYRSIIICPETSLVQCSSGLGLAWKLRLADGYLGGISSRYAALPWTHEALGLRSIRFVAVPKGETQSDWKLLSLLNVAQAIQLIPELYTNRHLSMPGDLPIVRNPSTYVYRRAYFAEQPRSVDRSEAIQALAEHFGPCPSPPERTCEPLLREKYPVDYVEGVVSGPFDASGPLTWRFEGDQVDLDFAASARQRLLVINEAYDPQWRAWAGDRELTILPTNVVMRGIVVPEGATHVRMRYRAAFVGTFAYVVAFAVPVLAACVSVGFQRTRAGRERVPDSMKA